MFYFEDFARRCLFNSEYLDTGGDMAAKITRGRNPKTMKLYL